MKIKELPKLLGIMMQIRQDPLLIDAPLLDIVYKLKVMLFLGKTRNKVLLLTPMLKQNIDPWLWLLVNLFGSNNFFKS